jgi:hypothetical protein
MFLWGVGREKAEVRGYREGDTGLLIALEDDIIMIWGASSWWVMRSFVDYLSVSSMRSLSCQLWEVFTTRVRDF